MKKPEQQHDAVANVLDEINALFTARQNKITAARNECATLAEDIKKLKQSRADALIRGDADALMQIDEQLRTLAARKEVAAYQADHAPKVDPETVQKYARDIVAALKEATDTADAAAIELRDKVREAYVAAMLSRHKADVAFQLLQTMAPAEMMHLCKLPAVPSGVDAAGKMARVYIHTADQNVAPNAWKRGLNI